MQPLPGFRDFAPEECARRNAITSAWREVVRSYGFVEYDGPTLEPVELYLKKSGGELAGQLFDFTDKGGRHVTLRPEMTPTLARLAAAKEKRYRKPLKWFSIGPSFRYEKQQRGRLREFIQLNFDLLGDASPAADAEVCALTIDIFRAFGFDGDSIVLRLSDRNAWIDWLRARGISAEQVPDFLSVIDKLEREDPANTAARLEAFNVTREEVDAFIASGASASPALAAVAADLTARGMGGMFEVDLTIVRGLAYYTGIVFEVFDRSRKLRALAGGGRYDHLVALLSDGGTSLPAIGVGIGDVVLSELIAANPEAEKLLAARMAAVGGIDLFLVLADENRRPDALKLATDLRADGYRVDYNLGPAKVGKQFQQAEQSGARFAAVIGAEWPSLQLKTLATRTELSLTAIELRAALAPARA